MPSIRKGLDFVRLFQTLGAYFKEPLSLDEAKALLRDRMERREELFLTTARERVFAPDSPYQPLLHMAQCEYRDVELMVKARGLEATLEHLRRAGVYLSFEEFKLGREVRRQGRVVPFNYRGIHSRDLTGLENTSGGTRSRGTRSFVPIEHFGKTRPPNHAIMLETLTDRDAPILIWQMGFPSGAGLFNWLSLAKLRRPPIRWFSLSAVPKWYRGRRFYWSFRAAHFIAYRAGITLPMPEFAPVGRVRDVLEALLAVLHASGRCVMITTPSCAVRLSSEALRRGEELRGVCFVAGGEPLTSGKAEEIRRSGARVASRYSVSEVGSNVGAPCGHPTHVDDMHFLADSLAMISNPRQFGGTRVNALMLTSLLPSAPKLLLNVEFDDFAVIEDRRCGCLWDALGYRTHVSGVRSFGKLTGEGTTVLGTNCVHLLENVLPETFGGSSVDYQLIEAEDKEHLTRLFLLVSTRVGPLLDESAVLRRFVEGLEGTDDRPLGGRRSIWDQADSIRVIRRDPIPTGVGKLLPFQTIAAATLNGAGKLVGAPFARPDPH